MPSVQDEFKSLRDLKTWKLEKLPEGVNLTLTTPSVRRKSRLVAKGFTQQKGQDHFATHWPTHSPIMIALLNFSPLGLESFLR